MNLPSARSTAIDSRAVAVAGLSSDFRGLRPMEFSVKTDSSTPALRVVQVHRGNFGGRRRNHSSSGLTIAGYNPLSLSVAHMIEQPLVHNSAQRKVGGSLPSTQVIFGGHEQTKCPGLKPGCGTSIPAAVISLRVAQRLERSSQKSVVPTASGLNAIEPGTAHGSVAEVDGSSPSPQELVGGLRSGLKNRVNASPARKFARTKVRGTESCVACAPAFTFPSVAIIDGHAPNGTCLRLVSHEFTALHQAADAVTGGNSI